MIANVGIIRSESKVPANFNHNFFLFTGGSSVIDLLEVFACVDKFEKKNLMGNLFSAIFRIIRLFDLLAPSLCGHRYITVRLTLDSFWVRSIDRHIIDHMVESRVVKDSIAFGCKFISIVYKVSSRSGA